MAQRLVQVFVPAEDADAVAELAGAREDEAPDAIWIEPHGEERAAVCFLGDEAHTGPVLDRVEVAYSKLEGFRVIVLPVEAVLPRPTLRPPRLGDWRMGVSREELYADLAQASQGSTNYYAMIVLSSVVAAIGLTQDNTAAVIGAMVVAPLLGPNMGLCLGLTLAQTDLIRSAVRSTVAGAGVALASSVALGLALHVDPAVGEIASRTHTGFGDLVLALAAGCAGALAYTSGAPAGVIGVMVAVALVPPMVVAGLLLAHGRVDLALGSLALALVNASALNLAGIATFLAKGVRPQRFGEARLARSASRRALGLWALVLVLLVVAILFSAPPR